MTRVYWRCNGGHYFTSVRCPFDGWSSAELVELGGIAEKLRARGIDPSFAAMRSEGVSESALGRAIIVEFGSDDSVFDAVAPDYYVINGKSLPLHKAGSNFH